MQEAAILIQKTYRGSISRARVEELKIKRDSEWLAKQASVEGAGAAAPVEAAAAGGAPAAEEVAPAAEEGAKDCDAGAPAAAEGSEAAAGAE